MVGTINNHACGEITISHYRKSAHGGHRAPADRHFFDDVADALKGAHEILVIGPAQTEVLKFARQHFPSLDRMR